MKTRSTPASGGGADEESSKGPQDRPRHSSRSGKFSNLAQTRLLKALEELPRHLFLPKEVADTPDDQPAALGNGYSVPPVGVVAMMLGALELDGSERVLDVGSGSGYQAALLGRLAREVISVELDGELAERSASVLKALGCANVRVIQGDASNGWPECAPYRAIVCGAATTQLPAELLNQLELGGRLVIALGDENTQLVERMYRNPDGAPSSTIGACQLGMLSGSRGRPSSFPWMGHH